MSATEPTPTTPVAPAAPPQHVTVVSKQPLGRGAKIAAAIVAAVLIAMIFFGLGLASGIAIGHHTAGNGMQQRFNQYGGPGNFNQGGMNGPGGTGTGFGHHHRGGNNFQPQGPQGNPAPQQGAPDGTNGTQGGNGQQGKQIQPAPGNTSSAS